MSEEVNSMTTTCIGTTRFMAPELFDKDRVESLTEAVDIWSLGCLLIEIFSSKRPWNHISSQHVSCIYYEIFQQKPIPIPESIPSGLASLISRCCQYDPKMRLSAREVLEGVEGLL
jgi:serine/threonine protein kinase